MNPGEFAEYGIRDFTPQEVEDTGARLDDIRVSLMMGLQKYRDYIRRRVGLLKNGFTTGGHKAVWHPRGLAADSFLYPEDGPINVHQIFKGAVSAGFRGIGIYYNGTLYSSHFDLRPNLAYWGAWKNPKKGIHEWQWVSLLNDPAKAGNF